MPSDGRRYRKRSLRAPYVTNRIRHAKWVTSPPTRARHMVRQAVVQAGLKLVAWEWEAWDEVERIPLWFVAKTEWRGKEVLVDYRATHPNNQTRARYKTKQAWATRHGMALIWAKNGPLTDMSVGLIRQLVKEALWKTS